jgi:hypothetical protein
MGSVLFFPKANLQFRSKSLGVVDPLKLVRVLAIIRHIFRRGQPTNISGGYPNHARHNIHQWSTLNRLEMGVNYYHYFSQGSQVVWTHTLHDQNFFLPDLPYPADPPNVGTPPLQMLEGVHHRKQLKPTIS